MHNHSDDQRTLPAPTDDRKPITVAEVDAARIAWQRRQLADLAPAGQLVLDGHPAQLSLDGAPYSTECSSDRSPERASRYLGPSHEVLQSEEDGRPDHPTEAPAFPGFESQLSLGLNEQALDDSPQLSLWQRLAVAGDLARRPRSCPPDCECHPFDRDAKCNRTRFRVDADPSATRHTSGSWSLGGLIKCGTWTCPSCGPARSRETASMLGVCFDRHLATRTAGVDADVWMLSLTIPHYADVAASVVVDQLYAASALLWRSKAWRQFSKRWGIVGRVRVLDATHGGARGSHPHFHIALFPTRAGLPTVEAFALSEEKVTEWTVSDRGGEMGDTGVRVLPSQIADQGIWTSLSDATQKTRERYLADLSNGLIPAWENAVRASGARSERPTDFRRNSVKLSPCEKASAYFVKWGLADEIGAPTAKARNHLRLLDASAAGVAGAAFVFKQWRKAVDGRAWVTGLTDICNRLGVTEDDARQRLAEIRERREAQLAREGTPIVKVPELRLVIRAHVYGVALALGWVEVFAFCDEVSARSGDVQTELDEWLWGQLGIVSRGAPDG